MSDAIQFVEFACAECKKKLKAPLAYVGKRVKCSGCGTTLTVPGSRNPEVSPPADFLKLETPALNPLDVAPMREENNHSFAWQKKEPKLVEPESPPKPPPAPSAPQPKSGTPAKPRNQAVPNSEDALLDAVFRKPVEGPISIPFDEDEEVVVPTKPLAPKAEARKDSNKDFDPDDPFGLDELPTNEPIKAERKAPITSKPQLPIDAEVEALPSRDGDPAASGQAASGPPAFRFTCKVCGTTIYGTLSEVGGAKKCPDCYELLKVPSPPANWNPKTAKSAPSMKQDLDVAPLQKSNRASAAFADRNVKDLLNRAELEVIEDEKQDAMADYEFDLDSWWQTHFGFIKDPGLIAISLFTGIMMGGALAATALVGKEEGAMTWFLQLLILVGIGGPLLAICLTNGLAILESTANQLKRVAEWPILKPGEWMSETIAVIVAFALAAAPGGAMARLVSGYFSHPVLTLAMIVMSLVLLLPPILLSILDNQSLAQPFSTAIFGSIPKRAEAWGGMYLFVALASFGTFILLALGVSGGPIMRFVGGAIIPIYLFFFFHQLGVLTLKISDLTSLSVGKLERKPEPEKDLELQ